ncbi:dTDP-4-amino-4,6-dideoxygalactose transaminase [Candidatus Saccharibacteria bacterium]|nr:dTDP-4-amino-4,6-dideoxygalactose transaminase [Candidatus Saccharibacteria bacterium]
MINFTEPSITDLEKKYALDALEHGYLSGDKKYTKLCTEWFNAKGYKNFLLTTSGSSALELGALLTKIAPGDEFIVPSFTFSSTANAFMLRGAKPIFAEIEPGTMNIDADKIEALITDKTKAIVPVDYAGVSCDMDKIMVIAKKHNLFVVEDAAQAVGSFYKDEPCGLRADIACFSFHETKNYCMGEGGAVYIKDDELMTEAEIIREKGTNRKQFLNGLVDKYSWYKIGSSLLPSDLLAAVLYGQLERFDEIMEKRLHLWNYYYNSFEKLEKAGCITRPTVPSYAKINGHLFYILLSDIAERNAMLDYLRAHEVGATFHYVPLHSAPLGLEYGYKEGDLPITEEYAGRLLRLPLHFNMTDEDAATVVKKVEEFFNGKND